MSATLFECIALFFLSKIGGRTDPTVQDFRLAFHDVEPSVSLKDVHSFCANVRASPLPDAKLFYPLPAESEIYTAPNFDSVLALAKSRTATDGDPTGSNSVPDGGGRPEWMDEDLIFPPIDQWLPSAAMQLEEEATSAAADDAQRTATAVADVIIGDDEEDVAEHLATVTSAAAMIS